MALLEATYEVTRLSGGQLRVVEGVDYVLGLPILLCGIVPALFFLFRMYKTRSLFPGWGVLIFACPGLFCGLIALRTGSLTLDKAANTALLRKPVWLWHTETVVPLDSIDRAEIRTMRASDYIALVLTSGVAMTFADSTQESGKGEAVVAINRYIGAGVR